ncbi:transmembrane protein 165-like isoform X2 [Dinothrombium tinctorium]|uniref:GDT1 family protein n=1 Tax=Dinothrombium tinctorium TaxID=1965070 RepID=A0A3S3PF76_9ACAR|nr:transmembrane protein 165-like isoform X2 [Dinothrombium tinctorium]
MNIDEESRNFTTTFHKQKDKLQFIRNFLAALVLILSMELGDKTFFIAIIMSMKNSRLTIFTATMTALSLMTLLSLTLGLLTKCIPKEITHYTSIILFFCIGLKMIYDAYFMTDEEEKNKLEEEISRKISKQKHYKSKTNDKNSDPLSSGEKTSPNGVSEANKFQNAEKLKLFSLTFINTFFMVFTAECGDRSQVATIALVAENEIISVAMGAILGQAICTVLAVVGGRLIAQFISLRTVTIMGGSIFIILSIYTLIKKN